MVGIVRMTSVFHLSKEASLSIGIDDYYQELISSSRNKGDSNQSIYDSYNQLYVYSVIDYLENVVGDDLLTTDKFSKKNIYKTIESFIRWSFSKTRPLDWRLTLYLVDYLSKIDVTFKDNDALNSRFILCDGSQWTYVEKKTCFQSIAISGKQFKERICIGERSTDASIPRSVYLAEGNIDTSKNIAYILCDCSITEISQISIAKEYCIC